MIGLLFRSRCPDTRATGCLYIVFCDIKVTPERGRGHSGNSRNGTVVDYRFVSISSSAPAFRNIGMFLENIGAFS